ncbi:Protein ecdysoneless-like protein [Yarrowia sp. C11]|nr:Protein ecdysoneless-like protein [Yarrowia sp. C11]KAG5370796.1 Protein ecdysoneless-like protein [Yarrowia sp. E02]
MDLDTVTYTIACGSVAPKDVVFAALQLCAQIAPEYMWYRDSFTLDVSSSNTVSGSTAFGPALDDEWLVVYILYRLTKELEVSVHVSDSDGDFLLIEAAHVIPSWLEPETAEGRLWISKGQFELIPRAQFGGNSVSLPEAVEYVNSGGKMDLNKATNDTILKRVGRVPDIIKKNTHRALVCIPLKLAKLVYSHPQLVIVAVDGLFQAQNHGGVGKMSASSELVHFPQKDMVTVSVKFTRLVYAEAMQISFDFEGSQEVVLGRKLTLAFERLFSVGDEQWAVSELKSLPVDDTIEFSKDNDSGEWLEVMKDDLEVEEDEHDFDEDGMKDTIEEVMKRLNEFMGKEEDLFKDEEEEEEEPEPVRTGKDVRDEDVVNEDEFFEFFLKDALKLKDDELASYLAKDETREELEEAGIVGDQTDEQMLHNLMQSLNSMGGLQGPAATMLGQLGVSAGAVGDIDTKKNTSTEAKDSKDSVSKAVPTTAPGTASDKAVATSTVATKADNIDKMTDEQILSDPSVLDSSAAAIERTFAPPVDDEEDLDYENDGQHEDGKLQELYERMQRAAREKR